MSEVKLLLPKFLTEKMAEEAIETVVRATLSPPMCHDIEHAMFHIVVLVPGMVVEIGNYPNYPIRPYLLAEHSEGNREKWPYDYVEIAQCKALQLWHDRNDGGTDIKPHLLFPGDTPFWGGVKRNGIVVACSGVQPYFDRMIAGMVADICIAYAYHAWMLSKDKADNELCFLT
ncbi:MAG: hypothetical protein PHD04_01730 [Candidatus Pacebacteria bacterium]|nr:hypothetical protein [Candidatus Paceibacterota bacterium]